MDRHTSQFDFDLLKLVPAAEEILKPVADIQMVTIGEISDAHEFIGASVWDGDRGFVAVFGFADSRAQQWKPESYAPGYPIINCSALEMFCDAWAKGYVAYVHRAKIWNGYKHQGDFHRLMYESRGWHPVSDQVKTEIQNRVANSLRRAVLSLQCRLEQYEHFNNLRNTIRAGGGSPETAMLHT